MHNLIKNTHRNELPYTSSAPDVWDAMIALDGDTGDESGNVKLIYGDRLVSAVPYDQGTCEYWSKYILPYMSFSVEKRCRMF